MEKIVYISLPMTGKEDTIWERYNDNLKYLHSLPGYENCKIISPYSIDDFNPENDKISENKSWGFYMGKNIQNLADRGCTDILMGEGWNQSKGCRVEHETAKILGINRLYWHRIIKK